MYITRRKKGDKIIFTIGEESVEIILGKFHKGSVDLLISAALDVKIKRVTERETNGQTRS